MVAEAIPTGPNRTRESFGRYLDDFAVGAPTGAHDLGGR